ncbi:uncharacterized protein BX664DRAFT_328730 [Halteromyces radiatus]|uniref:uncharacterized protein n=1 Tax=Halteromyces radiatus TaxID=101107 RepID=UPI00221E6F7D|nr:uncharacterized protein BX664DRAFT_328730 [Halteromyces radiatus]KAI8093018.1 hypothetical protein BX664DRAFT_328730 [Halteromyces radiatus]
MSVLPLSQDLLRKWLQQGIEKGYITNCIPTLNGENYLSAYYIQQQVIHYINQDNGRTTLTRLAERLNIARDSLEPYLTNSLLEEQEWILIDDTILTNSYLIELKQVCFDQIHEQGYISLVAQTQRSSLPYQFIQKILDTDITSPYINYSELSDLVFTKLYVEQQKNRIIETLQSALEPLSMNKLQQNLALQDQIFYLFLDQIIKDHTLQGTFRGRYERALFIPYIYRDTQLDMIHSLLKAGYYIEYSTIEQLYSYASPKDLLLKLDPDIILLDSCAVTPAIISSFQATLLSSNLTWLDASKHLPSVMSLSDIVTLVEMILASLNNNNNKKKKKSLSYDDNQQRDIFILLGKFVTTQRYLETIVQNAQSYLNQRATMEMTKNQKFLHSTSKGKRKKELALTLTNEEILEHLVNQQQLDSDFAQLVTMKIKRPMIEELNRATESIYVRPSLISNDDDNGSWVELQLQHLLSFGQQLGKLLYYNIRAVTLFEDDSSKKSMRKHLVRQLCLDFMFYLMLIIALWQSKDQHDMTTTTGLRSDDIEHPDQVGETQKKQVIAALVSSDSTFQDELLPLYQALQSGKRIDEFKRFLSSSSSPLRSRLNMENMQSESSQRQANDHFRKTIYQQLESTPVSPTTSASLLHLTSLACFQTVHQLPLSVSGKFVPIILKHISILVNSTDLNSDISHSTAFAGLTVDGKQLLQLLETAQTMILSSLSTTNQSPTPLIDLDLMRQIRQFGLDLSRPTSV